MMGLDARLWSEPSLDVANYLTDQAALSKCSKSVNVPLFTGIFQMASVMVGTRLTSDAAALLDRYVVAREVPGGRSEAARQLLVAALTAWAKENPMTTEADGEAAEREQPSAGQLTEVTGVFEAEQEPVEARPFAEHGWYTRPGYFPLTPGELELALQWNLPTKMWRPEDEPVGPACRAGGQFRKICFEVADKLRVDRWTEAHLPAVEAWLRETFGELELSRLQD